MKKFAAFLSPAIYPCTRGGMEIFNYFIVKSLSHYFPMMVFTNCNKAEKLNIKLITMNPRLFIFKRYGLSKLSNMLNIVIKVFINLNKIAFFDVPYTNNSGYLGLVLLFFKKCFNIPYILTIHSGNNIPNRLSLFRKKLLENAEIVVAVSQEIKIGYEKLIKKRIELVLPLIPIYKCKQNRELFRKEFNYNKTDIILLSLGSIKEMKGSHIILYAFIELGINYLKEKKLKLLFVGDAVGPLKNKLINITARENMNEYVKFISGVPYEDVSNYYKISDIYITASWAEGTSLSLLGAMYNETPIIATDVVGINSIIKNGETGLLFKKDSISELKYNIKHLIENKGLSEKLSHNAKLLYHSEYDHHITEKKYFTIYRQLFRSLQ